MEITRITSKEFVEDIQKSGIFTCDGKVMSASTALCLALYNGNFRRAKDILDKDILINPESPLIARFEYYDLPKLKTSRPDKIFNFLKENGANLDNYFLLAARDGEFNLMKMLLSRGANVNATDKNGNNALMLMISDYQGKGLNENNAYSLFMNILRFVKTYHTFDYKAQNLQGESFVDLMANSIFSSDVKQTVFKAMKQLNRVPSIPLDYVYER